MAETREVLQGSLLQAVIEQAARTCKQVQIFRHAEEPSGLLCVGVYDGVEDAHLARAHTLAAAARKALRRHHRPQMLPTVDGDWDAAAQLIEQIAAEASGKQMTFSITCSFGLGMPATGHALVHDMQGKRRVDVRLHDGESMLEMLQRARTDLLNV